MLGPRELLNFVSSRSENNLVIDKVYRLLYKRELYTYAYNNLLSMSKRFKIPGNVLEDFISDTISKMRYERFYFDSPNAVIVEELLSVILYSIFKSRISSCNSVTEALRSVAAHSQACEFFICGNLDFSGISNNVFRNICPGILEDNRLLELLRRFFVSPGFGSDLWEVDEFSGSYRGGTLSPTIAECVMSRLDVFIGDSFSPKFNRGERRPLSKEYDSIRKKVNSLIARKKKKGLSDDEHKELVNLRNRQFSIPSKEKLGNCDYRRFSYTRFHEQFIISFAGTKSEALEIAEMIREFVSGEIGVALSLSVHSSRDRKDPAFFLGYNLMNQWDNAKRKNGARVLTGQTALLIPHRKVTDFCRDFMQNGKPVHTSFLINQDVDSIVKYYQSRFERIRGYYKFAGNQHKLAKLKWAMEVSLVKTLSSKLRISCNKVYKKFSRYTNINGSPLKVIVTPNGNYFGAHLVREKIR